MRLYCTSTGPTGGLNCEVSTVCIVIHGLLDKSVSEPSLFVKICD